MLWLGAAASSPIVVHYIEASDFILPVHCQQVVKTIRFPSYSDLQPEDPFSVTFSMYVMCSSHLVLQDTHSSTSMSILYRGIQNRTQSSR